MSEIHLIKGNSTGEDSDLKAEGKTRFRVALISMAADIRTVYAKDAKEALSLCAEKNLGRHAGRQGPLVISVAVTDPAETPGTPDYIQMTVDQMLQAGAKAAHAESSMIEKPRIILPPGFDPKGPRAA